MKVRIKLYPGLPSSLPSGQEMAVAPSSGSAAVEEAAEAAIQHDPPPTETTEAAAQLVALFQKTKRKRKVLLALMPVLLYGFALFIGIVFMLAVMAGLKPWIGLLLCLIAAAIIGLLAWIWGHNAKKLLRAVNWEDLRLVGPLVEIYGQQNLFSKRERKVVHKALTHLLSRMRVKDASLLTEKQRAALHLMLKNCSQHFGYLHSGAWERYYDPAVLEAVIQAFTQIGDTRCLPEVKKLALHARDGRLQETAQACLPTLQALADQKTAGDTLLRASGAPTDHLLRPVQDSPTEPPDQLLRASKQ